MRNHDKPCQYCGEPIATKRPGDGKGRPALFCSAKCKDAARYAVDRVARSARRASRLCVQCGGLVGDRAGRALTCSTACAVLYQNGKKGVAIHRERLAAREARTNPCDQCGGPIPVTRKMGSRFCSRECVVKGMTELRRETAKHYNRQRLYGLSADEFDTMLRSQNGRCAICQTDAPGGKGFYVDHNHTTGAVRGLLCSKCNFGIGLFRDDPALLRAAANYLTT